MKCPRCGEDLRDGAAGDSPFVCSYCEEEIAEGAEDDDGERFDFTDVEDDGPCSHVFNGDRCDRCGAEYDPVVHGHRIVPEDSSW